MHSAANILRRSPIASPYRFAESAKVTLFVGDLSREGRSQQPGDGVECPTRWKGSAGALLRSAFRAREPPVIALAPGGTTKIIPVGGQPFGIAIADDGGIYVTNLGDGSITVFTPVSIV